MSERNRHPLVPPVLSELRSEVNAELERDRAFGAALARTGLLDMRPAELSPDVLGALVRAAVEATGHVIVSTEKARTE
ncbi:hypothetical protein OG874_00255 [Nocardia sp. NBC_00565]|uniref:hypothetical protein n=1 Tax=Nocardia sp. NBC_00565 TaxID=2975993 RepID=UPI002E822F3B|nr:hypothetical protein [Nocardia sp. NBC_00565]WUC03686.1 hypothetical protein OG874_00255 [Nocardia sp. NBC_00565]